MKCPTHNNLWCTYATTTNCWWTDGAETFNKDNCLMPQLVPTQPTDAFLLIEEAYTKNEYLAQIHIMETIQKHATPNNSLDTIVVADLNNLKYRCEYYLRLFTNWGSKIHTKEED